MIFFGKVIPAIVFCLQHRKGTLPLNRFFAAGILCLSAVFLLATPAAAKVSATGSDVQFEKEAQPPVKEERPAPRARSTAIDKVRLTWPLVPGAVYYQVVLLSAPAHAERNVIYAEEPHTAGTEIDLKALRGFPIEKAYWTVCGLDRNGHPVGKFFAPVPMKDAERRPSSPLILSDYASMPEAPLYVVYAWLPVYRSDHYEIEVLREANGTKGRVRHYHSHEPVFYDPEPFARPGEYEWRVRALDEGGRIYSDWSQPERFTVRTPVTVAAFGDSITHGGGAMETPPCRNLYCWEAYAGLPVKNLGRSGDTTLDMLDRFEEDVLPFAPRYLVIMGGVNDFRVGVPARIAIRNLSRLADKCRANGITPVFAAATPIHPGLMEEAWDVEPVAPNWQQEQAALNAWIMAQKYAVDTASPLTDAEGNLRADLTTDGLHPDAEAKKIIGETVERYLKKVVMK